MNKSIFTFFAFLIFTSFGCSSATENANTTVTNSVANTTATNSVAQTEPSIDINAPFAPDANPKNDLLNSTERLKAHGSWKATLINNLYPEMQTEMEYVAPNRFHFINPDTEMIIIGSDAYQKQKNVWTKLTGDFSQLFDLMKKSFNPESMKMIGEVRKTGVEKINGKDTSIYQYNTIDKDLPKSVTRIWIASDGLPLRRMVETQNEGETQRIIINYDYSKAVKIDAPKIQETPANK